MWLVRVGAFLPLLLLSGTNVQADELGKAELQKCEAQLTAQPAAELSAKCFADLGKTIGPAVAEHRLREQLAHHPELPWLSFYFGYLYWQKQPEAAEGPYRVAAGRFAQLGDARGEVRARISLCDLLYAPRRGERVRSDMARTEEESLE
ncbi:MAG TPA: hypothetical protein VGR07_19160, partial [Thermoanaerobaculia bacterium]|nr:hypothetical protein [Thermoanaerobaculia bacterium]